MLDILRGWFNRHFSDPQAVILTVFIILVSALVLVWGNILAPVLASVIIAYMLEGSVKKLQTLGLPRIFSVLASFVTFLTLVAFCCSV